MTKILVPSFPGQLQAADSVVAPVNEAAAFISSYSCRFRGSKPYDTHFNALGYNKTVRNKHPYKREDLFGASPSNVFTKMIKYTE